MYYVQVFILQELQKPYRFSMYLVNSKCVTFLVLCSLFPDYLCKCSNSGVVALVMSMYIKLSNVLPENDRYFLKHHVLSYSLFLTENTVCLH